VRQPQPELYKHAEPFGVLGLRIDGNDAVGVHQTASAAVKRARSGEGPTLLECMTYRWRGHVGPSYDLEYDIRTREELDSWIARDPIERLAKRMIESGVMTEAERVQLDTQVQDEVDGAMSFARKSPFPEVKDLLKYVYKD
jgi:pyruvate dehydrogenase E1 component alpha subunit